MLPSVLVRDVHFLRNEDGVEVGDYSGPENRHGGAHDSEVDLQAADDEHLERD